MVVNVASYAYGGTTELATPASYCLTFGFGAVSRTATGACQVGQRAAVLGRHASAGSRPSQLRVTCE